MWCITHVLRRRRRALVSLASARSRAPPRAARATRANLLVPLAHRSPRERQGQSVAAVRPAATAGRQSLQRRLRGNELVRSGRLGRQERRSGIHEHVLWERARDRSGGARAEGMSACATLRTQVHTKFSLTLSLSVAWCPLTRKAIEVSNQMAENFYIILKALVSLAYW